MDYPKLNDCSPRDIEKALRKLGGFSMIQSGHKHVKFVHITTQKAWMIPRHTPLKKGLVWDFVRSYLQKEIKLTEKQIFGVLWC